ncbi:ribosomal protein [Hirsutella rhossiliensis]|uniref:37s ribosomal protein s5 protein n=1 Tax=Hirsutella rhossiliensis TaxID=111463 RepID=A0A9P8N542_9HYPO|nr:putative 37s ribosomal protein s5 protein [Hirsutella rhossiliensis]KAH0966969.1 putative 37s ribosomal protein s5 protein [Hirsutella rhossiliensis]
MASSDAKVGRRRTDSSATSWQRTKKSPDQAIKSKSSHTADPFLQDFLSPSFDPAAFLNATLPPLGKRQGPGQGGPEPVPLAELSAQAQALLSQLNAHTTRLSNTLTQLTDDILRSGSRLAYEVELLRGETLGLSESLHETLQDDIKQFIPGGLQQEAAGTGGDGGESAAQPGGEAEDPDYIKQLQTLTLVRSRLDSVIKTFGNAMDFTFPPSELSVGSSFLSVSAPDPGSEQQSSEERGQQVLKQLRDEISGLLNAGDEPVQGIERAATRIEELKELTSVWKGTAEEKGRNKFIEGLAKMVEDRHRELMREMELQAAKKEGKTAAATKRRGSPREAGPAEDSRTLPGGFGLMSQLQKLRSGL